MLKYYKNHPKPNKTIKNSKTTQRRLKTCLNYTKSHPLLRYYSNKKIKITIIIINSSRHEKLRYKKVIKVHNEGFCFMKGDYEA